MADRENEQLAIFQNLMDAGCDIDVIERFFQLQLENRLDCQLALLHRQRLLLLDHVHERQKCLDCLDHLIHEMKKESRGLKKEK